MAGAVHRFPGHDPRPEPAPLAPAPSLRPKVVFESFEADQAKALLDVASQRVAGSVVLLTFIDDNRDIARHAGVETIGIELAALMEGDRFSRVIDALEEAVEGGATARISTDGLGILKRIETLLAESSANIRRFTEGDFSAMEIMEARSSRDVDYHRAYLTLEEQRIQTLREDLSMKERSASRQATAIAAVKAAISVSPSSMMGASASARSPLLGQARPQEFQIWIPLAVFGAIVITVAVIAAVAAKK